MKKISLYSRLIQLINECASTGSKFTSKDMIEKIGQFETTTSWKRGNKSPYYTLHMYVCQLNYIGAIKRTKRGEYDVCFVIPAWLDSGVLWILRGWRDYDYVNHVYLECVTETKTKWENYKKSTLVEISVPVPSPVPVQNTINIIETPNNNNSNMKELDIKSLLIKYAEKQDIIRFIAEELL
jgi:hypothetical protein